MSEKNKIVFATNNKHKLSELREIMGSEYEILSLSDIGCYDDIEETAYTIEGNALIKAHFISDKYGYDCFADDTGLEVEALNGAPGVYSARYAGDNHDSVANMNRLLSELNGIENRKSRFLTVIALVFKGKTITFEGIINGNIIDTPMGDNGFGYDPIFVPENCNKTFAQMTSEEKNTMSHRARATKKLIEYLRKELL